MSLTSTEQMDNRREVTITGRAAGMLSADRRGSPGTDQRRQVSREGIVVVAGGHPGLSEEEETGFQDLAMHKDTSR